MLHVSCCTFVLLLKRAWGPRKIFRFAPVQSLGGPGFLLLGLFFTPASEIKKVKSKLETRKWSAGRIHHVMWSFSAKFWPKNGRNYFCTWRLGAFKTSTFGITWCDNFQPIFGSNSQRIFHIRWRMQAAQKWFPCQHIPGTNHRNGKCQKPLFSSKGTRWSECPWRGTFRHKSQKRFGPWISDFLKPSVMALFWWAKGRRLLGPPNAKNSQRKLRSDPQTRSLTLLNALNSEDRGLKVRFSLATIAFDRESAQMSQILSSQGKNAPSNSYPHYLVRLATSRFCTLP